ncbi:HAD family hydrolase [Nocardiopsis ansamitocini]|uniref:Haloacid dehalogenase n=1 Tax=Nocardiopsis ansamitocini TaxID=1670832 RepID=A0A9W6P6S4_9ACTN|nr:HAD family phosphatase [Nocardiopsis ansamitocini]GLU48081.1 haloacid dehalogenase [Nocardiopsis ansamitocini]
MTAPSPITTVVFDYGNVICTPQPAADLARMEELSGVPPVGFWAAYWAERLDYDAGLSGHEYWNRVARHTGADWDLATLQALWRADLTSWLHPEPSTIALIDRLAAGSTRLALLSNAALGFAGALRDSPVLSGFDAVFFSCDIGVCKPDPAIYQHALDALGSSPQETAFIDDREENVRAAAELGIVAHHYTDGAGLEKFLDQVGVSY